MLRLLTKLNCHLDLIKCIYLLFFSLKRESCLWQIILPLKNFAFFHNNNFSIIIMKSTREKLRIWIFNFVYFWGNLKHFFNLISIFFLSLLLIFHFVGKLTKLDLWLMNVKFVLKFQDLKKIIFEPMYPQFLSYIQKATATESLQYNQLKKLKDLNNLWYLWNQNWSQSKTLRKLIPASPFFAERI